MVKNAILIEYCQKKCKNHRIIQKKCQQKTLKCIKNPARAGHNYLIIITFQFPRIFFRMKNIVQCLSFRENAKSIKIHNQERLKPNDKTKNMNDFHFKLRFII